MSKKKKAKAEQLARTQVLNLDEFRSVVRYEKVISKKPAIICTVLGTLMLGLGTTLQGVIFYTDNIVDKQKDVAERKITDNEEISTKVDNKQSSLTCRISSQENANGTNNVSYFTYKFINNELKSIIKIFMVDKIEGNALGQETMRNLYEAYRSIELNSEVVNGYIIKTTPIGENEFQVTTQIDLENVDMEQVPVTYQSNEQLQADFPLNTALEEVKVAKESSGYTCTINEEIHEQ